ncbi:hypothetical protein EMCRGX_G032793 [Ephydatia muelleri]
MQYTSDTEYTASKSVCKPLYNLILSHDSDYSTEVIEQQVQKLTQWSMDLAQEKGASNWLTTLSIDENGFTVHKSAFCDAIALSPSQERHSLLCQQTRKMVLDQTLRLMVSGVVNLNGHFLMSEFSISMPLPTTFPHYLVATENMKTLKRENMSFESVRSSRHHSPQLSSPQLEA